MSTIEAVRPAPQDAELNRVLTPAVAVNAGVVEVAPGITVEPAMPSVAEQGTKRILGAMSLEQINEHMSEFPVELVNQARRIHGKHGSATLEFYVRELLRAQEEPRYNQS